MNKKQLSEHIGNIDDKLIQQAESLPNYKRQRRQKRIRQLLATAAALVLMVVSFSVGAMAFGREIIIEVPVRQETLELEGTNLTLVLPDSWKGRYAIEQDGDNFIVYNPQSGETVSTGTDVYNGGVLFTIISYNEPMTEKQFMESGPDLTAYRYLLTTGDHTYILHYAGDEQYVPADQEQEKTYRKMMSEMGDIQLVVNSIFPPKDILVAPEGMAEEIEHEAQVKEPEGETLGFTIYVDTERYYTVEENEKFYIRPIGAEDSSELICEMEIQEMAGAAWEEAARTIRTQIYEEQQAGRWDSVSEISHDTDMERLYFYASEGTDWDSAQEEHYFYQMDGQGTFHIVLRYFLEATEGNGTRFHAMLDTFAPVTAQDASKPVLSEDGQEIKSIAEDFATAYFSGDTDAVRSYLTSPYEWDIEVYEGLDTTGAGTISELTLKGLTDTDKEETGSTQVVSLEFRDSNYPDMFIYLTLKFVRQENGWKIQFYGLEV